MTSGRSGASEKWASTGRAPAAREARAAPTGATRPEAHPPRSPLQRERRVDSLVIRIDAEPEDVDLALTQVQAIGGDRVELDPRKELETGRNGARGDDVPDAG